MGFCSAMLREFRGVDGVKHICHICHGERESLIHKVFKYIKINLDLDGLGNARLDDLG